MKVENRWKFIIPFKLWVVFVISFSILILIGCGSGGDSDNSSPSLSSAEFSSAYFSVVKNGSDFFLDNNNAPANTETRPGRVGYYESV
ncbi:MAG: hypothetical protein ACI845_000271 [Gammaproteobacteria bacterium]|jgi:hypothetical protein